MWQAWVTSALVVCACSTAFPQLSSRDDVLSTKGESVHTLYQRDDANASATTEDGRGSNVTFNRPIYLTSLYFLEGRYVDPSNGNIILPSKTILTFSGDDKNMATQFLLQEGDNGTASLQVRRLWDDLGFNRSAVITSQTFQVYVQYDSNGRPYTFAPEPGVPENSQELNETDTAAQASGHTKRDGTLGVDASSADAKAAAINNGLFEGMLSTANKPAGTRPADYHKDTSKMVDSLQARYAGQAVGDVEWTNSVFNNPTGSSQVNEELRALTASPDTADDLIRAGKLKGAEVANGAGEADKSELRAFYYAKFRAMLEEKAQGARKPKLAPGTTPPKLTVEVVEELPIIATKGLSLVDRGVLRITDGSTQKGTAADLKGQPLKSVQGSPAAEIPGVPKLAIQPQDLPTGDDPIKEIWPVRQFPSTKDSAPAASPDAPAGDSAAARPQPAISSLDAANGPKNVAMARIGGAWQMTTLVAKNALMALNIAGSIAGVAFIVVDLVNGNLVAAAWGIAGLGAGLAIGIGFEVAAAELGPIGWVIGAAVGALFFSLPGLAGQDPDNLPWVVDVQGILQWKFFGDPNHTGNEKCRTDSPGVKANPNCTAVFGPSFIAQRLNISIFDAAILVMAHNDGYAMSIDDLSAHAQVASPGHPRDTENQIFVIDCHNRWSPSSNEDSGPRADRDFCTKATFSVNRTLITIPVLNQTADKIFDRVANPQGDCRVVTYPEGQFFPGYNFTAKGMPTSIACGIQTGLNVSGQLVDATWLQPLPGNLTSAPENSTSGVGGAYTAPPPKSSFASLPGVCLKDKTNKSTCLLTGSYPISNVGIGPKFKDLTSLSIAPGAIVNVKYSVCARCPISHNKNYTSNDISPTTKISEESASDLYFLMKGSVPQLQPLTVFCDPKATARGFCVFSAKNYTGDYACFGTGGDNLPPNLQNKVQSMRVATGTQVEIFGDSYADLSATLVTQDEPDLSQLPIGVDSNFARKFVAAWAR